MHLRLYIEKSRYATPQEVPCTIRFIPLVSKSPFFCPVSLTFYPYFLISVFPLSHFSYSCINTYAPINSDVITV
jgi:hypothetical protein